MPKVPHFFYADSDSGPLYPVRMNAVFMSVTFTMSLYILPKDHMSRKISLFIIRESGLEELSSNCLDSRVRVFE